jgi:acetyltransferase-like isoleucine patch superfamily enzyme
MGLPIIKMATVGIMPSFLKKAYYRAKGAKIGKNVSLGLLSVIDAKNIEIGDFTKIGPLSFIVAHTFKTGKRVKINTTAAIDTHIIEIGDDSTIMEQVVIGGMLTPRSKITIGKRVKIFPYSFLNPTEEIIIEDDVGIGGANYIFTHGSWQSELDGYPVSFGAVTIKKGTWFPWRVFVMPGVTVGEYCTIGAGSVITKDIPDNCLAAGSPAKVLREKDEYVKTLSVDEKHLKMKFYINEFIEFMNFKGNPCRIMEETNDEISFEIKIKNKVIKIAYVLKFRSDEVNNNVVISLQAITEENKLQILNRNSTFFDVTNKETIFKNTAEWELVRDFLSRYGVRFNVIN